MDSAYYFREKAARCRLLLAVATNPEVREQLRLWVWEFEDRADSAERRGQRRQRMRTGWRRLSPVRFALAVMRGVHVQLHRHTAWLDDPRLCAALSHSHFSLQDPKRRPMTVYLAIPPDRLRASLGFVPRLYRPGTRCDDRGLGSASIPRRVLSRRIRPARPPRRSGRQPDPDARIRRPALASGAGPLAAQSRLPALTEFFGQHQPAVFRVVTQFEICGIT